MSTGIETLVQGVKALTMLGLIGRPGLPGQPLMEMYLALAGRKLPPGLELGALYIVLFWWSHNLVGIPLAYGLGFRLLPTWVPLSFGACWGVTVISFFAWTLVWFTVGYRLAFNEAVKNGYRPPARRL
ncbi:MAG: hypothetical protein Q6L54_11125 [Gloeomargarita sp. HHBFW_bins_205]